MRYVALMAMGFKIRTPRSSLLVCWVAVYSGLPSGPEVQQELQTGILVENVSLPHFKQACEVQGPIGYHKRT